VDGHVHRAPSRDHDGGDAGLTAELFVFGRTEYAEPLTERGTAAAGDDVLDAYRDAWVELVAFPRSAVHWIIRDSEDADSERPISAGR
jgi:hypothetical protein